MKLVHHDEQDGEVNRWNQIYTNMFSFNRNMLFPMWNLYTLQRHIHKLDHIEEGLNKPDVMEIPCRLLWLTVASFYLAHAFTMPFAETCNHQEHKALGFRIIMVSETLFKEYM